MQQTCVMNISLDLNTQTPLCVFIMQEIVGGCGDETVLFDSTMNK